MKLKDIEKMLRAIINGQTSLKQKLLAEIKSTRSDLSKRIGRVEAKVDKNGKRLDALGEQLAYLEDDTPTQAEHNQIEKRVTKIERHLTSI
jgi:predicted nuclease with TOPRIM domain